MQVIDPAGVGITRAGMTSAGMASSKTGGTAPVRCAVAASIAQPGAHVVDPETMPLRHRLLWLSAIPGKLVAWYQRRREVARTRRHLASFDARMLKDIGLSHADAEAEISKGFWRS